MNAIVRLLFRTLCRMNPQVFRVLPRRGPAILMSNHTTNLEGPAYYVFVRPRPLTGLGKAELWNHWFTRMFMRVWKPIPVRRGEADRRAVAESIRALDKGMFLGIAPEGTRSRTEVLQTPHSGMAFLATMRHVPVYPITHRGLVNMGHNILRLRRTRVVFSVGRAFYVRASENRRYSSAELRDIADEMMYELARLLPKRMRGPYEQIPLESPRYLEFIDA